ncbi:hypothetical protein L2E82_33121 [Cichorium intybus]|uniref:Uncharacterized protein n=1 Tax=Cichorium intybus TaxID=13427 RepID=A0ACB9BJJ4_CICIN|nr:hypothetical protein L2E82_33121 [Cichorium intybus]
MCNKITHKAWDEMGDVDIYNIYAPICLDTALKKASSTGSVSLIMMCSAMCSQPGMTIQLPPIIKYLIENGQRSHNRLTNYDV